MGVLESSARLVSSRARDGASESEKLLHDTLSGLCELAERGARKARAQLQMSRRLACGYEQIPHEVARLLAMGHAAMTAVSAGLQAHAGSVAANGLLSSASTCNPAGATPEHMDVAQQHTKGSAQPHQMDVLAVPSAASSAPAQPTTHASEWANAHKQTEEAAVALVNVMYGQNANFVPVPAAASSSEAARLAAIAAQLGHQSWSHLEALPGVANNLAHVMYLLAELADASATKAVMSASVGNDQGMIARSGVSPTEFFRGADEAVQQAAGHASWAAGMILSAEANPEPEWVSGFKRRAALAMEKAGQATTAARAAFHGILTEVSAAQQATLHQLGAGVVGAALPLHSPSAVSEAYAEIIKMQHLRQGQL